LAIIDVYQRVAPNLLSDGVVTLGPREKGKWYVSKAGDTAKASTWEREKAKGILPYEHKVPLVQFPRDRFGHRGLVKKV